jgi:hypothetical protein
VSPLAGPEVIAVLRDIPELGRLLTSLYECDYSGFFKALVDITPALVRDRYASHNQSSRILD